MDNSKLEFTESTRGKPLALYEGYLYRKHKMAKNNNIRWVCSKDKSEKCKGAMVTNNGIIQHTVDHNCIPDTAAIDVKKRVADIRHRAREEDVPVRTLYEEEIVPFKNMGYELIAAVPSYASVKRTANRIRHAAQGSLKESSSAKEIVLPDDIFAMEDGSTFLFADDDKSGDRIMVFSTDCGQNLLGTAETIFIDGTFKSCCKQFKQLYSFHVDIGSNCTETNIVPVMFALLQNKQKKTYSRLFEIVKEKLPRWSPKTVKIDFEMAAIAALRSIFPNIRVSGCNFHFNQCLWRKVQELGLTEEYKQNAEVRLHIRMCAALAYIPLTEVENGWLSIMEDAPTTSKLQQFQDYFIEQWMENAVVDIDMWNIFGQKHRTNNSVEGWNHRLNMAIKNPHPHIIQLIKCLKGESIYSDLLAKRKSLNLEGNRRKLTYIRLDERIEKIMNEYAETNDLRKCLKTLAYIQKMV